jgi:hypothetical protein
VTTFYVVCAGTAATLVGLLFVAVQIGPSLVTAGRVGTRHAIARSTFTVFAFVFMLSTFFLIPTLTLRVRAITVIAAGAGGILRAVRTWLPVWRDKFQGRIELRLWQTAWLLVGPVVTYAVLVMAGARGLHSADVMRFDNTVAYVFVVLFVIGLRNSWNLLVEGRNTP